MRNDARPIGEDNPFGTEDQANANPQPADPNPQSAVRNSQSAIRTPQSDADADPVLPTGDSTLNTKI